MRDERIGRQSNCFVEDEEGEYVGCKGDTDRARNGQRKADVEAGLVLLVVAAHITDRVQRGDDPQTRRDQGEEHAQRLDLEREIEAGQHLDEVQTRTTARLHSWQDDLCDHGEK
jgi:hypothetical protein